MLFANFPQTAKLGTQLMKIRVRISNMLDGLLQLAQMKREPPNADSPQPSQLMPRCALGFGAGALSAQRGSHQ